MTNPEAFHNINEEPDLDNMSPDELREFIAQALFTPEQRKIADSVPREVAEKLVTRVRLAMQVEDAFKEIFKDASPSLDPFIEFDD